MNDTEEPNKGQSLSQGGLGGAGQISDGLGESEGEGLGGPGGPGGPDEELEITPVVEQPNLKSKNTLKSYFETGDIPTQPQFADLIDALRHMDDGRTIADVTTSTNGITTLVLSDGARVKITPATTDEYVPKTGGGFSGDIAVDTAPNTYPVTIGNTAEPNFGLFVKNLGTQPTLTEAFRLGLKHASNENNGFISFYRGSHAGGGFLGLSTNGQERIKITPTGNVGIGGDPMAERSLHTKGDRIRIETTHGHGDMGSRNENWFHFETNRPNFWFNKGVRSNGNLGLYNKHTYMRFSDGVIFENNQRVATQAFVNGFFTGTKAKDSDKLDGLDSSAFLKRAGGTMTGNLAMTSQNIVWGKDTRVLEGRNNSIRIETNSGYVDVGPQNTGYVHFRTELPKFYFNKHTEVDGDIKLHRHNTYMSALDGAIFENNQRVATQAFVNSFFTGSNKKAKDSDKLDGLDSSAFLKRSGGTLTGDLIMTNQEIKWTENTDSASIGFKNTGNSDTNSYLYFRTTDDLNEHFKWLHSSKGNESEWMSLKNTELSVNGNVIAKGNIFANGDGYYGDGKRILRYNDANWLMLNPDNNFPAGVYCGNKTLKTHGQFEIGDSGNKFKVTSGGTVTSAGSITSAGNITAFSDGRLKTALNPVKESFLDKIDQLKPTYYQWKDKAKDQAKQLGFIAQEVKDLFPEWVHQNGEHYSMSYDKMGAVLAVQGIKELRAEVKALQEELNLLKNGITH